MTDRFVHHADVALKGNCYRLKSATSAASPLHHNRRLKINQPPEGSKFNRALTGLDLLTESAHDRIAGDENRDEMPKHNGAHE